MELQYDLIANSGKARFGKITTTRAEIPTPVFIPVGTRGTVKTLSNEELRAFGARIILGNTYHLYLRPGHKLIEKLGGLHKFSGWKGSFLTDSGGYQLFSLKALNKIDDKGVDFQSHIDGSRHRFTPADVIDIQISMGADIIMPLDVCTPYPVDEKTSEKDMKRTIGWFGLSNSRFIEKGGHEKGQDLLPIVQGATYIDQRMYCLEELLKFDAPGIAIGGLSVGEPKEDRQRILENILPHFPDDKLRYLMGVGTPEDILEAVEMGIDMFDCVIPTRNARNGTLFTRHGKMIIKAARYAEDQRPVDEECPCTACRGYSRAFIRHLLSVGEILGLRLASVHNVYFYLNLMERIREAIEQERYPEFKTKCMADLARGCEEI
ncbi:MAG: tRNA guanosine(34) transglycosylase Tgt [Candidatus Zixiibacteriota bacterium]|nr:MAG: tRNA guanosine(34) transglycosylase Tgt [candidate division Zixibacteria bacterium]